ncbi:MAG: hypothetical protein ACLFTZ_00365 [Acholeplasmataceae bacterium]
MPVVQFGNVFYFFYLIMGTLAILATIRLLKNKSDSYRYWFLFGVLVFNFALHYLKIFIYPYTTLDFPLHKVSLENVCAVNSVIFPTLFLTKNKTLKDYLVMSGMVSGFLAFVYPANAISDRFDGAFFGHQMAFSVEIIRFYISHLILFLVPFVMMHYRMHEISIKRFSRAPLVFIMVLFIIFINELILAMLNWIPKADLYDVNKRNPSLIFGMSPEFSRVGWVLLIFVPEFLKIHPLTGEPFFWPVVWMVLPVLIYTMIMSIVFCYIYDRNDTKAYLSRRLHLDKSQQSELK